MTTTYEVWGYDAKGHATHVHGADLPLALEMVWRNGPVSVETYVGTQLIAVQS